MLRGIFVALLISTKTILVGDVTLHEKQLDQLINLLIDKQAVIPLQRDFIAKIQSGLNLTNRSIFEELLMESGTTNKAVLRAQYQAVEIKMNMELKKAFAEKVDFLSIFKSVSKDLYRDHYASDEIPRLIQFFSTPVGQKYLVKSKSMIQESQSKLSKVLSQLAIQLAEPLQETLHQDVMKLLEQFGGEQ